MDRTPENPPNPPSPSDPRVSPALASSNSDPLRGPDTRQRALRELQAAAERSKRKNVAFAQRFIRDVDNHAGTTPLARLIQGGRGGSVRLPLYLLLTMIASQPPFDIRNPRNHHALARVLDLSPDNGPRRVRDNLRWLHKHKFIELKPRPGTHPAIQLLDPLDPSRPLPNPRANRPYVTIPISFWSKAWIIDLPPVAIAVLFALRELLGGVEPTFMFSDRRESYHLSHDTWTRGVAELKEREILNVHRVPEGGDFGHWRLRDVYELKIERFDQVFSGE
jgi:hypothetical protein